MKTVDWANARDIEYAADLAFRQIVKTSSWHSRQNDGD